MPQPTVSLNLAAVLDIHAQTRGTHPALVEGETTWSYARLAARVRQQAIALHKRGVVPGDLVGLGMHDCAEHVAAMFALARIGAIMLPMDSRWGNAETTQVTEHFRPRIVISDGNAPSNQIEIYASNDFLSDADRQDPADAVLPHEASDLPLLISLSSGTTGRPKGPAITHTQMIQRFVNQTVSLTFNWYDRFLVATPLYFGGGRTFAMSYLYLGGTVQLFPPPYKPIELAEEMKRLEPTVLFLVPTLLRRMLELDDEHLEAFAGLRLLISSGSPLFPQERSAVCDRLSPNYFEYYASTEGGGITVLAPGDRSGRDEAVGRPAFRVELQVVDDNDRPVAAGTVGRIRYRGPGVAKGFFRDPEADSDAFHEGWFYPGDLGVLDVDGFLTLRGRSKDMIIRGGANIYPVEVEQIIARLDGVQDVAVVGKPHPEFGEEVCAIVVADGKLTAQDVISACKEQLSAYKVPRDVRFVSDLPRTTAGKINKRAIVESLNRAGGPEATIIETTASS